MGTTAPCGAPAIRSSPTASSSAPLAPWPLNLLAGGGESSSHGNFLLHYGLGLWAKFDELGPLYIGVLVPMRRGFGILTNLSPTQFQIIADKANLRRG
jgi:hypothetical protein